MSFYVTEPLSISPAQVVEHSVDVLDPSPLWAPGTNWADGDLCHRVETRRVYRRVGAGTDTAVQTPEASPAAWQDLRVCNQYAAFEYYESTPTEQIGGAPLRFVLQPGRRVDTVGLYGLHGKGASIKVRKGADVVFALNERSLQRREVSGWYDWFTAPFLQVASTVWIDIPPMTGATIEIEILPVSDKASVQYIVLGRGEWLGDMEWNPEIDADNYSEIRRAMDGSLRPGVTLMRRRSVPRFAGSFVVPANNVDRVRGVRARLGGIPALWVGLARHPNSPYYQSLLLFGLYRRFPYSPDTVHDATAKIEIEEL